MLTFNTYTKVHAQHLEQFWYNSSFRRVWIWFWRYISKCDKV